jgi:hypothetical protein
MRSEQEHEEMRDDDNPRTPQEQTKLISLEPLKTHVATKAPGTLNNVVTL